MIPWTHAFKTRKITVLRAARLNSSACVTGITGYLGSELVTQLLDRGYIVHGTVRRIDDARKLDYVMSLKEKYVDKLHIYEADILSEEQLVHAMDNEINTVRHFVHNILIISIGFSYCITI